MIQVERHDRILDYLQEKGLLTVDEAVQLLEASPATIRRDFDRLARQNLAVRARGALKVKRPPMNDIAPFAVRETQYVREKASLARQAVTLLQPNDVVIVDGGTTTFQLAHFMPAFPLRVVTNSLPLAGRLAEQRLKDPSLEVFLIGGYVYAPSSVLIGPHAREGLSHYHAPWTFLSCGGVNEREVSNTYELVVETERAMIASGAKRVLLADHSKVRTRALCHVCPIEKIDILITDVWPENEPVLEQIREAGVEVMVVEA